ncbi:hypothetical protein AB0O52_11435 [Arthrobacter sp. NPDC080073]|uniref:hypothetical protein n=1 Tax=Arthrobacter sp. NPDC080073 TaxID=3155919 RepID=UPI003420FA87
MPNDIKNNITLRELGDIAGSFPKLRRLLDLPWKTPPTGYTKAHGFEDRWEGPEIIKRRWIITPVWDMATGLQTVELWMAKPNLAPDDAIELAADLIAAAQTARTAGL